jgi:hypothetical protein
MPDGTDSAAVPKPALAAGDAASHDVARRRRRFLLQAALLFMAGGAGMLLGWLAFFYGVQSVWEREKNPTTQSSLVLFDGNSGSMLERDFVSKGSKPNSVSEPSFTYTVPPGLPLDELLPKPPKLRVPVGPLLSDNLARVPEVSFGAPPGNRVPGGNPREEIAKQVVKIAHLNKTRIDGFMEALSERADLSGLPLLMGDACRMDEERSRHFEVALNHVREAENNTGSRAQPMPDIADAFWNQFLSSCRKEDQTPINAAQRDQIIVARIAALMQVLAPKSEFHRKGLVQYLAGATHVAATRTLAKLVLFSAESEVRDTAVEALKVRREADYTAVLMQGLSYPWPAVAHRAAEALIKLKRQDVVPELVNLLDQSDPRAPVMQEFQGQVVPVVRELVKLNHHQNCLLCHSPGANLHLDPDAAKRGVNQESLTAAIAIPGEPLPTPSQGYRTQPNDLVVRVDVTYLRQDFSVMLPVADAHPWPALQRFDFLVRSRVLSEREAAVYRATLAKQGPGAVTPYERAIVWALRELTGRDTEPTAAAWHELLGLGAARQQPTAVLQ